MMKKNFLLTILITHFFVVIYGQKVDRLEILPNGVNGYLVRDFPNKSSGEIFKSIQDWSEYNIYNADYSTNSTVQDEYISFKINNVGIVHFKNKPAWNLDLYVEIRIKPEKARIDLELLEIDAIANGQSSLPISGHKGSAIMGLYKKNGTPVKGYSSTRIEINKILNQFCEKIFDSVKGKKDYKKDDW